MGQARKKPLKTTRTSKKPARYRYFHLLLPLLITFVAFYPALNNGFVNWDDPVNFLENPYIADSDYSFFERLAGIFTSDVIGNYNPLSIASFLIDKSLFGFENPAGWHLINILLHLGVVLLIFFLSLRLTGQPMIAMCIALLFGVHPLHVESVAWITERKDLLYSLFYIAAMIIYMRYRTTGKSGHWVWVHLLFILALLSKIQAVALPLSLVLIDYLSEHRLRWKHFFSKWTLFLLSLVTGITGLILLSDEGSLTMGEEKFNLVENLSFGSYSLPVYIFKFFIPYPLSSYYPYPESISAWHYLSLLSLPLLAIALFWFYKKNKTILFFGLAFFLVNIIFVLQFLKAGQGFLADRFMYIPLFGLLYMCVVPAFNYFINRKRKALGLAAFLIIASIFVVLTQRQCRVWKDGESLWSNVIEHFPDRMRPYAARGNNYYRENNFAAALADYNKALSIKSNPEIHSNRAKIYMQSGAAVAYLEQALEDLDKAIKLEPSVAEYYLNRGVAYTRLNNYTEAVNDFSRAVELDPALYQGYLNRARILKAQGKYSEAIADYSRYLQYQPEDEKVRQEKVQIESGLDGF